MTPKPDLEEIWMLIKGYEGSYHISNYGNVKSMPKATHKKTIIKKPVMNACGYLTVELWRYNKSTRFRIHRLVADAFIPNLDKLPQINHRDSDKENNYVGNLEWCDDRHNRNHFNKTRKLSSKYPGVSWNKKVGKWETRIREDGRKRCLGYFKDEIDAAEAYIEKLKEIYRGNNRQTACETGAGVPGGSQYVGEIYQHQRTVEVHH